ELLEAEDGGGLCGHQAPRMMAGSHPFPLNWTFCQYNSSARTDKYPFNWSLSFCRYERNVSVFNMLGLRWASAAADAAADQQPAPADRSWPGAAARDCRPHCIRPAVDVNSWTAFKFCGGRQRRRARVGFSRKGPILEPMRMPGDEQ